MEELRSRDQFIKELINSEINNPDDVIMETEEQRQRRLNEIMQK